MLGYLAVGVLIGPHALALAQDADGVALPGRVRRGVPDVRDRAGVQPAQAAQHAHARVRARAVAGGADDRWSRLLGNALLAGRFALPAGAGAWAGRARVALGGALAMSSTAIVVKLMAERLELESEHGRRVMGVLLFQDLAVVPLLVLIPALGAPPETLLRDAGDRAGSRPASLLARAAGRRPARDALVADAGGAAQERRAVRAEPAAGHAGPGLAHRARPACRWRSAPSSPAC